MSNTVNPGNEKMQAPYPPIRIDTSADVFAHFISKDATLDLADAYKYAQDITTWVELIYRLPCPLPRHRLRLDVSANVKAEFEAPDGTPSLEIWYQYGDGHNLMESGRSIDKNLTMYYESDEILFNLMRAVYDVDTDSCGWSTISRE